MFRRLKKAAKQVKTWAKNHKTLVALIVTALFVLSQIPLLNTHEISSVEGRYYENAKYISLDNFYELNRDNPQPLLWQVLLVPLAKLGLPAISANILALTLTALAVFLIIRSLKMHLGLKLVLILSSVFCYFNPIVTASFSLLPLAVALIALTYEKRHESPLKYALSLALLTQTTFLISGLALALALAFIVEEITGKNKGKIKHLLLFIIPVALAVASFMPSLISAFSENNILSGKALEKVAVENQPDFVKNLEESLFGVSTTFSIIISIILLALIVLALLSTNLKLAFFGVAGIGAWFYILTTLYRSYSVMPQKTSALIAILFLILIFAQKEEKKLEENFISKLLGLSEIVKFAREKFVSSLVLIIVPITLISVPVTIASSMNDFRHYDTNSAEVYNLINSFEKGSLIVIATPNAADYFKYSVLAGINNDIEFYDIILDKFETKESMYNAYRTEADRYDKTTSMKDDYVKEKLEKVKEKYDHIYYFSGRPACNNSHIYNFDVIGKYEQLLTLGIAKYDRSTPQKIDVYKIK